MKKNILFGLIILFALSGFAFSQNGKNIQILLKGKVTDEFSGKGVEVTMEFREPDGKKFKVLTNALDGSYQQVVDAGKKFDIVFINYDVIRKSEPIQIDDSKKYVEQIANFSVKRLVQGLKLIKLNAFGDNQSSLKEGMDKSIEQLKEIMQFSRSVKFDIEINSHDTYKKITKESEVKPDKKKSKKAAKSEKIVTVTEPDANLIKSLVDSRIAEISKLISNWFRFKDRITVSPDYSSGESTGESYSLTVVVKEIKNIFE